MTRDRDDEIRAEIGEEQDPVDSERAGVSRRSVLRLGAAAGLGASLGAAAPPGRRTALPAAPFLELEEATIADLGALLRTNRLRVRGLVNRYLRRIESLDTGESGVNSIIELNPDAFDIADQLDDELRNGIDRGPLHGIPILLKDNIDTGDSMQTAAGSLALVGAPALQDSTVAAKLRAAGAVILGKTTLSEWANFRGFSSSSGWSGRGGQCRNPYVLDRNPCGSSSGSGAAVAASLCAASLGTETDGSIVCPSSANCVVGIKPTVGLTSRAGVIPISATQDTVGPHGRTIADATAVLGALTGIDPRDPATAASQGRFYTEYSQFLDPDGLAGARIGVVRQLTGFSAETDEVFEEALAAMADAGAVLVDPVDIPSFDEFAQDSSEIIVLVYEFKRDLNAYLATRTGVPVGSMLDVINFNLANADRELLYFGQEWFELAEAEIFSEEEYLAALERGPRLAGPEGIDAALKANALDALVAPTNSPAWPTDLVNGDAFLGGSSSFGAVAGYPLITMPAGLSFGLPVGITFMGTAWSEPQLITLCSGFENANPVRQPPTYIESLPLPFNELERPRATTAQRRSAALRLSDRLAAMRALGRVPFHSL